VARTKKRWSDFSPGQQTAIIVGGAIEIVLTATALRDLRRRSADQVSGSKAIWALSFVVQPFGPLAYFAFGRIGR
jgi:Phospholipase_D-nuclease N-terminal